MRKIMLATVTVAVLAVGTVGCSGYNDSHGVGDAPVQNQQGQRKGDDSPARVTNFPDGFANVATKCVAPGFRGFVTTATVDQGQFRILPDLKCV